MVPLGRLPETTDSSHAAAEIVLVFDSNLPVAFDSVSARALRDDGEEGGDEDGEVCASPDLRTATWLADQPGFVRLAYAAGAAMSWHDLPLVRVDARGERLVYSAGCLCETRSQTDAYTSGLSNSSTRDGLLAAAALHRAEYAGGGAECADASPFPKGDVRVVLHILRQSDSILRLRLRPLALRKLGCLSGA